MENYFNELSHITLGSQQGKQTDAYHLCFISLFIVFDVFLNMLINESFTANPFLKIMIIEDVKNLLKCP